MTRFRILLLLSLGAGCQAGGSGGPEEAEWALRAEAARNPGDAALQARWKEARTKAAADSFAKIEAALKSGDLPAAERRSEVAVFYVPENAEYRRRFGEVRALRRDVREQIRQADEAMRRRDWVRARRILEPIGTYQASFPQIGQMWPIVAKENFGIALREGERFMKVQDYEESRAWYEDALKLFPDDADARAKWKTADNRARARVLAHEAEELVAAGRLEDGVAKAREASALHPESTYVRSVLEESLRLAALEFLDQERKARAAGQLREALAAVRRARALEVPQEGLRAEIEARDGIASREVAAKLVAAGLKEEQAARVGTAWIYHSLASRVQPGFTGVKERLEQTSARVAARAVYRIAVLPAAEGRKTAPGSGELLSRAVRDALGTTFSGVVRGYAPMDLQGSLLRETQQPPDALLGGTVDEAWLESPAPKIERLTTRYESGKVPNLNGNVERLKERWEQSQAQLPESARNVAESEKRRAAVQADLNRAQAEYNGIAARQVTTLQQQQQRDFDLQASGNRVQQAQQKMLFQELETQTMKATHVVIEKDIQDKLDAYLAEPPYVFEPVYRDYVYEKALFEVRATLAARITLRDLASGEAPAETPAAASFTVQDTVIAPFPEAGIAGDPVEIPKDPELLERLAREAAKDLCSKLDGPLRRHGERLLARAAKERTRGDAAAELHYLALAWHARSTVEEARRKELAARVKEISGLDLEGTEVEVPRLPATSLK